MNSGTLPDPPGNGNDPETTDSAVKQWPAANIKIAMGPNAV